MPKLTASLIMAYASASSWLTNLERMKEARLGGGKEEAGIATPPPNVPLHRDIADALDAVNESEPLAQLPPQPSRSHKLYSSPPPN